MGNLHEECGVFGVFADAPKDVAEMCYYGLFALQHRGQQSAGIVVNDDGLFHTYKDEGLVEQVFKPRVLTGLGQGNIALAHVRYSKCEGDGRLDAQPITVNHVKGRMALAHNGALTNAQELREALELKGSIFHTTSDTEVISYIITDERLRTPSIEQAVNQAMDRLEGAYSLVVMSPAKMIAVRDKFGFRPLCYGRTEDGIYVVASESCALAAVGAQFIRDLAPGEILVFTQEGVQSIRDHCNQVKPSRCVFEYVYFSRPDSVVDGCSVHHARLRAGEFLAQTHPVEADIVIGVPDSGIDAAIGYAQASGVPYGLGFIKNKYIGRTFISPTQGMRRRQVSIKLNVIADNIRGKRVVMVDDSIVRGTTCARIVKLLRDAGAKEVHMRVSSPPFTDPCYYGTDVDSKESLIANNHTIDEIASIIGVDSLGYLTIDQVSRLTGDENADQFCLGCFNGQYATAVPQCPKRNKFGCKLSERANKNKNQK